MSMVGRHGWAKVSSLSPLQVIRAGQEGGVDVWATGGMPLAVGDRVLTLDLDGALVVLQPLVAAGTYAPPGVDAATPLWVAASAADGAFATSSDGATWAIHAPQDADGCNDLVYAGGKWAWLGRADDVYTSTDGVTWAGEGSTGISAFGFNKRAYKLSHADGLWVAAGSNGVATSSDAATWTAQSLTTQTLNNIAYGNGLWVAVGSAGFLATSPDGTTWTTRTSGTTATASSVGYGDGRWIATFGSNQLVTSTDGTTWTATAAPFSTTYSRRILYADGLWVAAAGANVATSSDGGATWALRDAGFGGSGSYVYSLAYADGLWVAGADENGQLSTSPDGITWTLQDAGFASTAYIGGVAWGTPS